MQIMKLKGVGTERRGYILILMVLIVFIIGALIWLDPMALIRGSGSGMPWNEEGRLVRPGQEVKQPKEGQPKILDNLVFEGAMVENNEVRGGVGLFILTDGRIKGVWTGKYNPEPDITWEVVGARFNGNIDPTKIYSDKDGEDPRRLYFIAKGKALIMVTDSKTDKIKTVAAAIYVTGWLDNEYKAVGKVTITSDKKTCWEYYWQSIGKKAEMVPDFGRPLPGLF
jgi:hypothetical protein